MPILEFQCDECKATFEELVQNPQRAGGVSCNRCGSARVLRLFSTFAAGPAHSASEGREPRYRQSPWSGGGGCGCSTACGCR